MLKNTIIQELGQEYCELLEEGYFNSQVREMITEQVRNEHDGEIWELVDSEENVHDFDFDDFLYEIVVEIESLGNYYYDNIQEGKEE